MAAKIKPFFQLSDVEVLQSMEAVVGPLNEGIVSISNICKSLLEVKVDPTTDTCSNYKQIRGHIEHAEQCLEISETTIKGKLANLDKWMESLTKEKENIEQQKKEKCMAKDKLHIEKKSAEESLTISETALRQAQRNVEIMKDALQKEKDRQETGKQVAAAGLGITFIPIVGWIAGPIMMSCGENTMADALNGIRNAECDLKENERQVNENNRKVSNYRSRISRIETEIKETDKMLNEIQRKIEEVKQHLEGTATFQEVIRKAVNLLSVLSGRVTVLERQTQRLILWQPVINALEAVVEAAGNIEENQFLSSQGAFVLTKALRENIGEVLALCNSTSDSENDCYY